MVILHIGDAFDVVGERKRTDFRADSNKRTLTESFEIRVRPQYFSNDSGFHLSPLDSVILQICAR